MEKVRITLPSDYGSAEDNAALIEAYLAENGGEASEIKGEALSEWAFEDIHARWPGLGLVENKDFGAIFYASQPKPLDFPAYYWVETVE